MLLRVIIALCVTIIGCFETYIHVALAELPDRTTTIIVAAEEVNAALVKVKLGVNSQLLIVS